MQVLRTVGWVVLTTILVGFVFMNWGEPVAIRFWPLGGNDALLFEWPIGFVALFFALIGFLPMWLLYRGTKWRLKRRIKQLEAAARMPQVALPAETASPVDPV